MGAGQSRVVLAFLMVIALLVGAVGGYFVGGAGAGTVTVVSTRVETVTKTVGAGETITVTKTVVSTVTQAPLPPRGRLVAFVWEDFTVPEVFEPLKAKYPELQVENTIFTSQPEMLAKLRGGFEADVVSPCIDFLPRLIDLDMLEPIETWRLKNWDDLFPALREYPEIRRGDDVYLIPTAFGVQGGVTYRMDKVEKIESWADVFNPQYKGRVLMPNDALVVIPIGALILGYEDPWKLTMADLERIRDFYIENGDVILKFYDSDVEARELLAAGDAWMIVGSGPAHAYWLRNASIPAQFILPDGKGFGWLCGLSILETSKNKDAAHAYIDHFISEEIQFFYANEWLYGPSNENAFVRVSPEKIEQSGMVGPEVLNQLIPFLEPENVDEYLAIYEEILASLL